ncbi:F-box only protein 36b [Engraulis encrasicolus]|uniref:F-box only protein 36b n=1 Tax=Engraulis encrasicolus TaxID=184585 RepID=UPI002FD31F28
MASLLGKTLFEINGQGPAPMKDYFILQITKSEVIWRWWKISLRCESTKPGQLRESHTDYLEDSFLQSQVRVVFGPRILQHTIGLCEGRFDYLVRLPTRLLLRIMAYLDLEDIARLGQTCRNFRKLCDSDEFWKDTLRTHCNAVPDEVEALANDLGWKTVFFTSKLQLQKQISRRRQRTEEQNGQEDINESPIPGFSHKTENYRGDWAVVE